MRVSEYYNLGRTQGTLDFVDVDTVNDIRVYIDPSTIRHLNDDWGRECIIMLTTFFDSVLDSVKMGDKRRTSYLLGNLGEPNETHLGISSGKSAGRGFGKQMSVEFASKLEASQAAKSGLIEDLEDTSFFLDRVDKDIISDITTNIIRGPLIIYTQQMAGVHGIPLEDGVASGPVWNPLTLEWEQGFTELPVADGEKLLLVPKVIVRRDLHLSRGEYYRNHLAPTLQSEEEADPTSKLVRVLKDGRRKVTKDDIRAAYGSSKPDVIRETLKRPDVYENYRETKKSVPPNPITHEELAEVGQTPLPDYEALLSAVLTTPPGKADANNYHRRVEALLSALFYPSLSMPELEEPIHEGRKRVDISYTNNAANGFFRFLTRHKIPSKYIFVECKNYGSDAANPELDQLSSRFSPLRGQFGILACRSFQEKARFLSRCRDTALDHRGYVIALDDGDLATLVSDVMAAITWVPADPPAPDPEVPPKVHDYPLLHARLKAILN
ncbi:hypothetical protein OHA84_12550 [Streptomyces sp. NBC_00513]|uniref:hypothetical protein n=1 Tax=unclassified Streptomyces TaxID=2593676 RepID=UPI00224F1368|nr:hypothetical protein [Streptomyces sp. NBC_00424]MCX5075619.1 hypothetical protein [Streptomyces sp. NBC_00424]WUD41281.1 hypothetical protein OHA84_12550 [Streptomyces sp. NBC_00513]